MSNSFIVTKVMDITFLEVEIESLPAVKAISSVRVIDRHVHLRVTEHLDGAR